MTFPCPRCGEDDAPRVATNVVFPSVSDNPTKWQSYTKGWAHDKHQSKKHKTFKEFTFHWLPGGDGFHDIRAVTSEGEVVVGNLFYGPWNDDPKSEHLEGAVEVHPQYRRQGIASALYAWAEHLSGKVFAPASSHTPYAEALWSNPQRPFGKHAGGPVVERVAARFLIGEVGHFGVGDIVLYGKYKNHRGRIVKFDKDKWGNPTVEVEPIPKGRKQNKVFGLFKIWRADLKENALAEQAKAEQAKQAARVAARFMRRLAAKPALIVKLEEAYKAAEATGDLKALHATFSEVHTFLRPGGKFPSWYQNLAPQKMGIYRTVWNATESALKQLARPEPLPDKFRTIFPLYIKELEKLGAVFDATHESSIITHGPWKVHNIAGISDGAMTEVLAVVDKAGSHIPGKFHEVLYGGLYLGNRSGGGHGGMASYLPGNDTVQINMKAFGANISEMMKSFIHELGHRYWFKFMKGPARVAFTKLSTEPAYVQVEIHYDSRLRERVAEEYLQIVRSKRKKSHPSPELVGWLRALHEEGALGPMSSFAEAHPEEGDKILAMVRGTKDRTIVTQGEKIRDGISVSEYGASKVIENFADAFAFYALKRDMHPDMVHFFDHL